MKKFDLDYEDDTFDDFFDKDDTEVVSEEIIEDNTEDEYDEYEKFKEVSEISYIEEIDDNNNDNDTHINYERPNIDTNYLSLIYKWFSRTGVVIAVILMAIFITNGDFLGFFKYILLLVGSFMGGYLFMFLFDKYKESN